MDKITTGKKWKDVLPVTTVSNLLTLLDGWQQQTQLLRVEKNKEQPCGLFFYGGDKEKRKAAAALAGMHTDQQVFRIDIAGIVSKYIGETEKNLSGSKYIGETEKNLAKAFAEAEQNNWILFCDEADALFGKRSNVKDSHDKYANQVTRLLLDRIEKCRHLIIVSASNKEQIPVIVSEHFQAAINFEI